MTGGAAPDGPGYFVAPTVVAGVTPEMRIFREEVLGPVMTVTPFDSEDEAARWPTTPSTGSRRASGRPM